MYKLKKKYSGMSITNTLTGKVIYLNNATTQEELEYLYNKNHPAVYFKAEKKEEIKEENNE